MDFTVTESTATGFRPFTVSGTVASIVTSIAPGESIEIRSIRDLSGRVVDKSGIRSAIQYVEIKTGFKFATRNVGEVLVVLRIK